MDHDGTVSMGMKKNSTVIAVTGVCSWLGDRLLQLLEKSRTFRTIIALDVAKPLTATQKTKYYQIDLTRPGIDEKILHILKEEDVEIFLHLAFVASPSHERSIAHELEVIGTMHVLNALSQSNVRKLIAISTTAVYGATPKNPNFLTEDIPLMQNMESRFIRDKIDAELQIKRFKEKYPDRTVTVLRMASVLGPRVSTYLSRFLSRQVVPVIMGYDPLMQFMHEDDAVRAFELSIINEFDGVFNIVPEGVMPLTHVLAIGGGFPCPFPISWHIRSVRPSGVLKSSKFRRPSWII